MFGAMLANISVEVIVSSVLVKDRQTVEGELDVCCSRDFPPSSAVTLDRRTGERSGEGKYSSDQQQHLREELPNRPIT